MGRIKTTLIKRVTLDLVAKNKEAFSTDFDKNKEVVGNAIKTSKKMRNVIAGYATRIMKKGDKFFMKNI